MMATAPAQDEMLYPQLNMQNFRSSELVNIKQFMMREIDHSRELYKKYEKLLTFVVSIRYCFVFVSVVLNAFGIGALSKFLLHDLAIYFESASLGADLLTMMLFFIEKKIMSKIEYHDKIHTLAAGFFAQLLEYFSKALDDQQISQQELSAILNLQEKYVKMRKAIRKKDFNQTDSQDLTKLLRARIPSTI